MIELYIYLAGSLIAVIMMKMVRHFEPDELDRFDDYIGGAMLSWGAVFMASQLLILIAISRSPRILKTIKRLKDLVEYSKPS